MISPFHEIVEHDGFDFRDYLNALKLISIFECIFNEYQDEEVAVAIVKYIAYAFSRESKKISFGGDSRKEQVAIMKELGIPNDDYYEDLVLLKNQAVREAVNKWMEYQDERHATYLFVLRTAYIQQQTAALADMTKKEGEIDWDQKMRCVQHMSQLRTMIKEAENELMQNDPRFKEAAKEVRVAAKKVTLGPEKYSIT